MAGSIAFSIFYVWRLVAAALDGQPLQGRAINEALSNAGLAGFLVFVVLFICLANDAWVAGSNRKKARRKLMKRKSLSDHEFLRDIPKDDRGTMLYLRTYLGEKLGVPGEKIRPDDELQADLGCMEFLLPLYGEALDARSPESRAGLQFVMDSRAELKDLAKELQRLSNPGPSSDETNTPSGGA